MTMSGLRAAVILTSLIAVDGSAWAETWRSYVNDRFGASVEYPDRFSIRDAPPDNSDGQRFHTADRRATLAVFGFLNVLDETSKQIMEGRKNADTQYTLASAHAGAFTLSGRRGDRIVYLRCLRSRASKDIWVCADLEYPAAERAAYDPIVTRIAGSLRAGKPW